MTQIYFPAKDVSGLIQGPSVLKSRPNVAYAIGLIAAEWAILENQMVLTFADLTGDVFFDDGTNLTGDIFLDHETDLEENRPLKKAPYYRHTHNRVAFKALANIDSLKARLDVMFAGLDELNQSEAEEFEILAKRIRKVGTQRNIVVHGLWGVTDEHPEDVILLKPFHRKEPITTDIKLERYSLHDFELITKHIHEVFEALQAFRTKVLRRKENDATEWLNSLGRKT